MPQIVDDLGSKVVGSAADGLPPFAVVLQFGCKSKIANFDFHVLIEHDIAKFKAKW